MDIHTYQARYSIYAHLHILFLQYVYLTLITYQNLHRVGLGQSLLLLSFSVFYFSLYPFLFASVYFLAFLCHPIWAILPE